MNKTFKSLLLLCTGMLIMLALMIFQNNILSLVQAGMNVMGQQIQTPGYAPLLELRNSTKSQSVRSTLYNVLPRIEISTENQRGEESPIMTDINGDGLMDFVYSHLEQGISPSCDPNIDIHNPPANYSAPRPYEQYILINTGRGFQVAYSCAFTPAVRYFDTGNSNSTNNCFEQTAPNWYQGTCANI
jgi:hypothetical protein